MTRGHGRTTTGAGMRAVCVAVVFSFSLISCAENTTRAADAVVPEGEYNCHKISGAQLIHLATLEIKGTTYRTSKDASFEPFTVAADKTITWSKGMDFLPDGWKLGVSKYEGPNAAGQPRLTIRYTSATARRK
ncbi:MAG: hypothetical protein QM811_15325 [Pirellulales bacterium]